MRPLMKARPESAAAPCASSRSWSRKSLHSCSVVAQQRGQRSAGGDRVADVGARLRVGLGAAQEAAVAAQNLGDAEAGEAAERRVGVHDRAPGAAHVAQHQRSAADVQHRHDQLLGQHNGKLWWGV